MARLARIVVPSIAHHVTQRGNRRQEVFFADADYEAYRDLVAKACAGNAVSCLAWCLMPNHVHLILKPSTAHVTGKTDGLTDLAAMSGVHRNWRAMLRHGLETGDIDATDEAAIEASVRTGRPWGDVDFLDKLEHLTGRTLIRQKPGPKPQGRTRSSN